MDYQQTFQICITEMKEKGKAFLQTHIHTKVVTHDYNPSTWEAGAGKLGWRHPGLHRKFEITYLKKPKFGDVAHFQNACLVSMRPWL